MVPSPGGRLCTYVHCPHICSLEALACGTPVVATSAGGVPEQVEDGRTGFLVPPGDVEAMAAAVKKLLRDETVRRGLAKNALEDICHRFDLNRQVEDYLDWYYEILENWQVEKEKKSHALSMR